MQQIHVLLLFGGESSEHEVSIESARNVYAAIDDAKFKVSLGYIDRQGAWWLATSLSDQIDTSDMPQLLPHLGKKHFMVMGTNETLQPDVILPILHGKNGEDGAVQALATLLHIPMAGCGMTASALCMDKVATKQIARMNDIPVVEFDTHRIYEPIPGFDTLVGKLGDTLFVKPANAGSSVGVSKVRSNDEFQKAIELAHKYDDVALIERAVTARELEIAVLGNAPDIKVSRVGEIKPDDEFYSYESKYDESSTSEAVIPAQIDADIHDEIQRYAHKLFLALGCRGLARIDFFLDEAGKVYLNEINTMPGFTNISMYPKLWLAEGVSYPELVEELLTLALKADTIDS
ncbi:MAG TPA: D-alanine--D-alanine ligase family protein [Candidatus Saccharimonadales bacterium]|nr:D-alanine--D-alanine ligase family protein [Candidatus Saccharimonadales bacterium]